MKIKTIEAIVFTQHCILELMEFEVSDRQKWKNVFELWRGLKFGMREFNSREPNFPEGLSEIAFCLWSGSSRLLSARGLSNTSFDTFNSATNSAEQIKACSVEKDLTSFGPRSKWDDLYFLDFFNNGKVDGIFDVYLIPDELIFESRVSHNQTLRDQQMEKRRPRFSIKSEIIELKKLRPIGQSIKIW